MKRKKILVATVTHFQLIRRTLQENGWFRMANEFQNHQKEAIRGEKVIYIIPKSKSVNNITLTFPEGKRGNLHRGDGESFDAYMFDDGEGRRIIFTSQSEDTSIELWVK